MSMNLSFIDQLKEEQKRIKVPEQILGKGAMMPYNATNSGSRKLMQSVQIEHNLGLLNPEPPLLQTGYENKFGEYNSSLHRAKEDLTIVAKIEKLSPLHYFLITKNDKNEYDVIERIDYEHISESYGYLYNNKYLDSLQVNQKIPKNKTFKKSLAYDEYDNRQDGRNMLSTYMSTEYTKEDSITISETAKYELAVPLISRISFIINPNDLPLNIYGDNEIYKSFPDIGEDIKDGILCALRRENIEECLYSQSATMLRKITMSDKRFIAEGKVIDIIIHSNQEDLSEIYSSQVKYYNDKNNEFLLSFVDAVRPIIDDPNSCCSYELQKMYWNATRVLNGTQYLKEKPFSGTHIEFVVLNKKPIEEGDKMSNRYGGKGVVSLILPDELMPKIDTGETVHVIWNSGTCFNRENTGQLFENELSNISIRLLEYMSMKVLDFETNLEIYLKFIELVDEEQGAAFRQYLYGLSVDEQMQFMESVMTDKGIYISSRPLSTMTIDIINRIYKEFPFIRPFKVTVPQLDSNNNYRYIEARRPLTCGYQYIYRLKQYAEEKFSAVSLASTNIKNENSRSSSKKNYTSAYSRTPIKFGEMETGNLIHLGIENVIVNLMIHSSSPHGRRLAKKLLIEDPYEPNIILDAESKNRSVEILNAYLKTMGLAIDFIKIPKNKLKPIVRCAIERYYTKKNPIYRINKDEAFDAVHYMEQDNINSKKVIMRAPIVRIPVRKEENNNGKY